MARTKKSQTTTTEAAAAAPVGRSRKRTVLTGVVVVAAVAGAYVFGSGRGGSAEEVHAEATTTTTVHVREVGPVVDLPAMNLNLDDGHFLRVAVSVALREGAGEEDVAAFNLAIAQDLVVSTLSGRSVERLATAQGRNQAKRALRTALADEFADLVEAVYFTDFVTQ